MFKIIKMYSFGCMFFILILSGEGLASDTITVKQKFHKIDACFEATRKTFDSSHVPTGGCECKNDTSSNYPWSCSIARKAKARKTGDGIRYAFDTTEAGACSKARERTKGKWSVPEDHCTCGPRSNDVFCFIITHHTDGNRSSSKGRALAN
jgi:hypothetical protein